MNIQTLLFASSSASKLEDILDLAGLSELTIEHVAWSTAEIGSLDVQLVAEAKAASAFGRFVRPLFVDHTSLELAALRGFPGTLSSQFWEKFGNDTTELIRLVGTNTARMEVCIRLADGRSIVSFRSGIDGTIAGKPVGSRNFSWDRIFIPEGSAQTFAEMTIAEKNALSPRALAFRDMLAHIERFNGGLS